MAGKRYIEKAIKEAINERNGWFKMRDIAPRVTELVGRWPISVQRIAQHVNIYEIPVERREIRPNHYEYRRVEDI